jgi:hypothetical protein
MTMVIVVVTAVVMAVGMSAMGMIGAAGRLEWLLDVAHACSQALQHRADDVIAQDEDTITLDLGRQVPVTQMPGKLDEVERIPCPYLEELFGRGLDLDRIPVVENQPVSMMEQHGVLEVEHHHTPVRKVQKLAAQMPQIMRQRDDVDRWVGDLTGRSMGMDMLHFFLNSHIRGRHKVSSAFLK